jgi:hypothetical protein
MHVEGDLTLFSDGGSIPPTSIDIIHYSSIGYEGTGVPNPRPLAFLSVYLAITPNNWQPKRSQFGHTGFVSARLGTDMINDLRIFY